MVGPARHTYGRAALLAVGWLLVAALLALGAAWSFSRFDPDGSDRAVIRWTGYLALALLPLLAGAVHRSTRVVAFTALFETFVLVGLLALVAR